MQRRQRRLGWKTALLAIAPLTLGLIPGVPHPFIHAFLWWVPVPERVDVPEPREGVERVLIIAPHPDDEVLALGSTIAQLARGGDQVLVVFLTNGDANRAAKNLLTLNPLRRAPDFRALGYRRQKEAVRALGILGVPESHAMFLGYPDGGLYALWTDHWEETSPYRSPFTRASHPFYSNSFNPEAVYAGAYLAQDLATIVASFEPTIVYMPHEKDKHPDHRAAFHFGMDALYRAASEQRPEIRLYVVHVADWPMPVQLLPGLLLTPPELTGDWAWYTVEFPEEVIDLKLAAVRAYTSQVWTNGRFLGRFVRASEVYAIRSDPNCNIPW